MVMLVMLIMTGMMISMLHDDDDEEKRPILDPNLVGKIANTEIKSQC